MSRARVDDGRREVKVTDPVCGMQVDSRAVVARVTHEGREFYFWSVACSDKFAVDPAKYSRRWREPGASGHGAALLGERSPSLRPLPQLALLVLGGLFLRAHVDVEGPADHSGSPNLLPFRCHFGG
jgi:YHS domain-containing protein